MVERRSFKIFPIWKTGSKETAACNNNAYVSDPVYKQTVTRGRIAGGSCMGSWGRRKKDLHVQIKV